MNNALPWWLRNGHVQTILPALDWRSYARPTRHQHIEMKDGDFLELTWFDSSGGPLFILLPGMGGNANALYICLLADRLQSAGYGAVVLEARGATKPNRLAHFYHAGFIDDLAWLVNYLSIRNRPLVGVGFSLGGSQLLRWLAEAGQYSGLQAAVTISMTFDLGATACLACQGMNRFYQRRVLRSYLRTARAKCHLDTYRLKQQQLCKVRTMRDFDEIFTAPIHGFNSAADYYRRSSSRQFLSSVKIPTMLLAASDDPLIARESWPQSAELPLHMKLNRTKHGGHLGFVNAGLGYTFPQQLLNFCQKELRH